VALAELQENDELYNLAAQALEAEGWTVEIEPQFQEEGVRSLDQFQHFALDALDDLGRIRLVLEITTRMSRGELEDRAKKVADTLSGVIARSRRSRYKRKVIVYDGRGNVLLEVRVPDSVGDA
jgi:hypothetical protein